MKIATWNLARPKKTSKKLISISDCLNEINADLLILTETTELISLKEKYNILHSTKLFETFYADEERRVSIYSKYPLIDQFETFRSDTSICAGAETPDGVLVVYGTIIGINGNKRKNFITDLNHQLLDFARLSKDRNFCIAGDLNMTFSDNYYFTKEGRQNLNNSFEQLGLTNLTAVVPENIDHIILTKGYVDQKNITVDTWNNDKKLSDHIGVAITVN